MTDMPAHQREHAVALGLLPPQLLELLDLVRVLRGDVVGLREVVGQVVELPADVPVRVPVGVRPELRERRRRHVPREPVGSRRRPPAVLVHAAAAEHLEVLRGVPLGGLRVVERVEEAGAVHRLLLDPVDRLRLRDAGRLEDGRADVDARA